jgi:uncharacterized protein
MTLHALGIGQRPRRLMGSIICAPIAALLTLALAGASAVGASVSKDEKPLPTGYRLEHVSIPMRDGVRLDTFVVSPTDLKQTYPILLVRTPYEIIGSWAYLEPEFTDAGYIFVMQSARGRYKSEGDFLQMTPHKEVKTSRSDVDASSDTYDTIDWLIKNIRQNNGRVGLRGISYGGFYAAAGMIDAHPALKAVSPQAPQADWFAGDDVHHNGAFLLASAFNFFSMCDRRSDHSRTCAWTGPLATDGYQFFLGMGPLSNADAKYLHGQSPEWQVMMNHGTYDELWESRNLLPHLRNIKPAVLAVSGWYDANNLYGAIHVFEAVRKASPGTPDNLVLGPWTHGQWARGTGESAGALHFGSQTSADFIKNIELPFFEAYLKGEGRPNIPVARVFNTGSNKWGSFDTWPPRTMEKQTLYLLGQGSLGFQPLEKAATPYDEYVSDPAHPVPFVRDHGFDMDPDYMAQDQRFASGRTDVLTYQTAPLTQDLTIIGPVRPRLVVSSSAMDSDWVVKVIDVHPDSTGGLQELVRGDVMRAKFRESLAKPMPMTPGQPTSIDFTMLDVFHTFKAGHRVMVQVQSSWFPLVDRNPQQFEDIYSAKAEDFHAATQRVFHSRDHSSQIDVGVLPAE